MTCLFSAVITLGFGLGFFDCVVPTRTPLVHAARSGRFRRRWPRC